MRFLPIRSIDKTTGEIWTDQYAIRSECSEYTVCKVTVSGVATFEAWHGKNRLSTHSTPDEARSACADHAEARAGGANQRASAA